MKNFKKLLPLLLAAALALSSCGGQGGERSQSSPEESGADLSSETSFAQSSQTESTPESSVSDDSNSAVSTSADGASGEGSSSLPSEQEGNTGESSSSEAASSQEEEEPYIVDCRFEMPEGFVQDENQAGLFLSPTYPDDPSNINITVAEKDPGFSSITADQVEAAIEGMYKEVMATDIDVTILEFAPATVDGFPALRIRLEYELEGAKLTQLQYTIDADMTYSITYTQVGDAQWMDAFEKSAGTIDFIWSNQS